MSYFHHLGLENFRLFKENTGFDLAPITILTGINNSGKSSLIKSLQLFKSSIKETGGLEELSFTGGRHNLGTFGLVLNNESDQDILKFTFDFPLAGLAIPTFLELKYKATNKRESGELIGFRIFVEGVENEDIFEGWREYNDSIENKYKVNLPFLLEHFLKVYNDEYFEEQIRNEDEGHPDFMESDDHFLNSISASIFQNYFYNKSDRLYFPKSEWDNETHYVKGLY